MGSRKFIAAVFVVAAILVAAFSTSAFLPSSDATVVLDDLTDPPGQWPDCQVSLDSRCADRCANVFVVASKNAHEYWKHAARTRNVWELVGVPVLSGLVAWFALLVMRRWRRLWPGWAHAVASYAAALLLSSVLFGVAEAHIGGLDSLRDASSALLSLRERNLWANEKSCQEAIEKRAQDPIGRGLEHYRGLGANFSEADLPQGDVAVHNALKPRFKDILGAMGDLNQAAVEEGRVKPTGSSPPTTEPGVYGVAPSLVDGARTHFLAFGPNPCPPLARLGRRPLRSGISRGGARVGVVPVLRLVVRSEDARDPDASENSSTGGPGRSRWARARVSTVAGYNLWIGGSGRDLLQAARATGIPNPLLRGLYIDPQTPNAPLPAEVGYLSPRPAGLPANLQYLLDTSRLAPVVLNPSETTLDLRQGFHANPKVGAIVMATGANPPPIQALVAQVRERVQQVDAHRIRIIGSVFGGSSTTLTPILTAKLREDPGLNIEVIEVYALLPWFGGNDHLAAERPSNPRATLLKLDEIRRAHGHGIVRVVPFARDGWADVQPPDQAHEPAERNPWLRWVAETIFETDGLLRNVGEGAGNPQQQANQSSFVTRLRQAGPAPANATKSPSVRAACKTIAGWQLARAGGAFRFLAQMQLPRLLSDLTDVIEMSKQRDRCGDLMRGLGDALGNVEAPPGGENWESSNDNAVWHCLDRHPLRVAMIPLLFERLSAGADAACIDLLKAEVLVALERWLGAGPAKAIAPVPGAQADTVYEFTPEAKVKDRIVELTTFQGAQQFRSKSVADPMGAGDMLHARLEGADAQNLAPDLAALKLLWQAAVLGIVVVDPEPLDDPMVSCRPALGYPAFPVHRVLFHHVEADVTVGLTHPKVGLLPAYPILDGTNLAQAPDLWSPLRDAWPALETAVNARAAARLTPPFLDLLHQRLPSPINKLFPQPPQANQAQPAPPLLEGRILRLDGQVPRRLLIALPEEHATFLATLKTSGDTRIAKRGSTLLFNDQPVLELGSRAALFGGAADQDGLLPWGVRVATLDAVANIEVRNMGAVPARWQ